MTRRGAGQSSWPASLDEALDQVALLEGAERTAWIDALAARDAELAEQVRHLVAGADSLQDLDHGPAVLAGHLTDTHGALPHGTRLGSWRLLRELGRGGMGRVYLAERADGAFEKKVAIKVLRQERRLPDAVMEHERALLARLEHPGLTRLLDGGISADGDVYLVMELVEGQSLDEWCSSGRPDRKRKLALFDQILDAVAHAHRQLVVHGDLKPDNIYIDNDGRVKVIDFGVARLLTASDQEHVAGLTPGWAAPECRAGGRPHVAADIYSLGKLLQRLLDGCNSNADKRIPKDLAAIIAHATEEDPDARYSTVMGLRRDLQRFGRHEPVAARRGGRVYHLARFVRRNWLGSLFAIVMLGVVVTAGSIIVWQNAIVRIERDNARLAAARSQTVLDYLLSIVGQAGDPDSDQSVPLRDLLADSMNRIDADFRDDPAARQAVLARLGELLTHLNDFRSAEPLLQRFLNAPMADKMPQLKARVLDNLAVVRMHQGQLDAADELVDQGLSELAGLPGDQRGARAELLLTRGQLAGRRSNLEEAIDIMHEALSLRLAVSGPEAASTVVVRNSLAAALMRSGQFERALEQFRQIDTVLVRTQRSHSLDAATIYGNYATTAFAWGRYHEADELFTRALGLYQHLYGASAGYAALLSNSGRLQLALGHVDEGRERIARAVAMMVKFTGTDSIESDLLRLSLGRAMLASGQDKAAAAVFNAVQQRLGLRLGNDHPLTTRAASLALMATASERPADDPEYERVLTRLATSPRAHRLHASLLCRRAMTALQQGHGRLAVSSADACLGERQAHLYPQSPPVLMATVLQQVAQAHLDGTPLSSPPYELEQLRAMLGSEHPDVRDLAALSGTNGKARPEPPAGQPP